MKLGKEIWVDRAEQPQSEDGKDRTSPKTKNGKDHDFTPESLEKKSKYKQEQTQPDSKPNQPKGGENRSDGAVYVPGFGWIEDSGEENKTKDGNFDITGEKVGDM